MIENNIYRDTGVRNGGLPSAKVFIKNLPESVDWDDFRSYVGSFGSIKSCEPTGYKPSAVVEYFSPEDASSAIEKINHTDYHGTKLKAVVYMENKGSGVRGGRRGGGMGGGGGRGGMGGGEFQHRPNSSDMPLRMVVDARFVGAIIGQGGANIREITRDSKARCVVDVNRGIRDQSGAMEKVINIYGMPENCSKACLKILEVVQREAAKESDGTEVEPELKLRAHNQLVGRLIGKGGVTIKKIMDETSCTIFVSNISELNAFNMERTITIRGTMENITVAEERISFKLRQCWENDMMNGVGEVQPHMTYGGPHHLMAPPCIPPAGPEYGGGTGYPVQPQVGHMVGGPGGQMGIPGGGGVAIHPGGARGGPQPMAEVVHMWVPNNIVGALIGTKGVHIRNVMRLTGAHIRIEGGTSRSEDGRGDGRQVDERQVTVTGTDQQQYKAQFWVYQRVCEQGYHFFDEVRLCTEISVPTKLVGRIIGKGGQNVRELQRMTGAQVKIPEDAATDETVETIVRVTGNFNASQAVQLRIRQLVQQFHMQGGQTPRMD